MSGKWGFGPMVLLDGRINSKKYIEKVLASHLVPYMDNLLDNNPLSDLSPIFQEDNATVHKSKETITWKRGNCDDLLLLPWPAKSPDLNPIEHLWDTIERRIRPKIAASNIKASNNLEPLLHKEWELLVGEREICHRLVDSMPSRVKAVIDANGWYTRF